MSNILFLDANDTLQEAILYAKECGYRVITCDNMPAHSCHRLADKSYNISTYDLDALKVVVEHEYIDGIVYMSSAHGLYAACRLNEWYHLPGIPYSTERLFSDKALFRELLEENHLDNPAFQVVSGIEEIDLSSLTYPVIIKPADAGGGNAGITRVLDSSDLFPAVEKAFSIPSCSKVLIESYIDSDLRFNGDCLICDGILKLCYLGSYVYSDQDAILPYATIFSPSLISDDIFSRVKVMIQRLVSLTRLENGIINIELRIGHDGKIYFIEVNPRHSGNQIFRLMNVAYGVNMSEIAVKLALGKPIDLPDKNPEGNYAYALLYASEAGILDRIDVSSDLREDIINYQPFVKKGDAIHRFVTLRDRLALLHLTDNSSLRLYEKVTHLSDYYKVRLQ